MLRQQLGMTAACYRSYSRRQNLTPTSGGRDKAVLTVLPSRVVDEAREGKKAWRWRKRIPEPRGQLHYTPLDVAESSAVLV